ncbi:MAG: hypothetical protein ACE5HX_04070 [bacterium]
MITSRRNRRIGDPALESKLKSVGNRGRTPGAVLYGIGLRVRLKKRRLAPLLHEL